MILELKDVVSGYGGAEILHGVSLGAEKGQTVSILGPNGAGKTTMLKAIIGLLKKSSGEITFDGHDITRLSPDKILRSGLAYVPQDRSMFPWLNVKDNLLMGAYLERNTQLINSRLEYVYQVFPRLFEKKNVNAGALSGGERQMLTVGRALMLRPKVLMLDEPSLSLDPNSLALVYNKLSELKQNERITIVLVEQNIRMALKVSDYTFIVRSGRIVQEGKPEELSSRHDIQEAYFGGVQTGVTS